MKKKRRYKKPDLFLLIVSIILFFMALSCLLPIINVLAISFSDNSAVAAGEVSFWPVDFTLAAYKYVLNDVKFFKSLIVSVERVLIGPLVNVLLVILCAYPLSKDEKQFHARKRYVWIFYFTTLFGGGMIPTYMVVNKTGMINSFWSLIIPGALPVGNMIMMMNFLRNLPKEMEEAALIDGASQWKILWKIQLPLSKACVATIFMFSLVYHWNSWYDGMIYFNTTKGQPMATYLHNVVVNNTLELMAAVDFETLQELMKLSTQTTNAAQLILAMLPILVVYPFMRKYFSQGIVMGSVKG